MELRLVSNLGCSKYDFEHLILFLCLLNAGITCVWHHAWFDLVLRIRPHAWCMLSRHFAN